MINFFIQVKLYTVLVNHNNPHLLDKEFIINFSWWVLHKHTSFSSVYNRSQNAKFKELKKIMDQQFNYTIFIVNS